MEPGQIPSMDSGSECFSSTRSDSVKLNRGMYWSKGPDARVNKCGSSLRNCAAWFRKPVLKGERLHWTAGTLPAVRAPESDPYIHPQVREYPGLWDVGLLAARTLSGLKP
ncbi:hypothetical protein E5288_WYG001927 [Bos mutus]|uniref:Uncharacterized protein n=1 Tax=Bos mutus TaxID=72004 RepID=A0A6B0RJN4_9CETA|nr:hypothetical protein [Bos mutus]